MVAESRHACRAKKSANQRAQAFAKNRQFVKLEEIYDNLSGSTFNASANDQKIYGGLGLTSAMGIVEMAEMALACWRAASPWIMPIANSPAIIYNPFSSIYA